SGETSPLEVSLSAGFCNLSYFYREFKKKFGMTPKEFIEHPPTTFPVIQTGS
ncbi:MAG: AraC family transcriptional regulator, partial [Lachnospiraceae bacterium]|nr:AraC family transcriptional regulator [Lachnospiraceae bacterium]